MVQCYRFAVSLFPAPLPSHLWLSLLHWDYACLYEFAASNELTVLPETNSNDFPTSEEQCDFSCQISDSCYFCQLGPVNPAAWRKKALYSPILIPEQVLLLLLLLCGFFL